MSNDACTLDLPVWDSNTVSIADMLVYLCSYLIRFVCAAAGHEMSNDALPVDLPVWDSKTNRTVVTATNRAVVTAIVSPEPNHYSLVPADFKVIFEQASVSWMLSQAVSSCHLQS
jgi:hypothetical protein